MRIRDQNMNVEHLDPILSTREKKYSSCLASWSNCMLFSQETGDTPPALPCWLPCQVEGAPSLASCLDGPLWPLAAKKEKPFLFRR